MLVGFEFNTDIQDVIWDDKLGAPALLQLDEKVCRDLLEILHVETGLSGMIGQPNLSTLIRVQEAANRAQAIYANRQTSLSNLDPREQIVNFEITGVEQNPTVPTEFSWKSSITFRSGTQTSVTI